MMFLVEKEDKYSEKVASLNKLTKINGGSVKETSSLHCIFWCEKTNETFVGINGEQKTRPLISNDEIVEKNGK
jgi:hypothetical protein